MRKIPRDNNVLPKALSEHSGAVINYVKNLGSKDMRELFNNISQINAPNYPIEFYLRHDNWEWLEDFILADALTLRKWVRESPARLKFNFFLDMYSDKFAASPTIYLDKQLQYNAYTFINNLNVKVCPYCDEKYIDTLENNDKRARSAQIDHFFPKAVYPALAMCFYNLVPICEFCNSKKGTVIFDISPYEADIEEHTRLGPDLPIGINYEALTEDNCTIKFHPTCKMEKSISALFLESRYQNYKSNAYKYLLNAQQYGSEELVEKYAELIHCRNLNMAYLNLFDIESPDSKMQRVLGKLRHDITGFIE